MDAKPRCGIGLTEIISAIGKSSHYNEKKKILQQSTLCWGVRDPSFRVICTMSWQCSFPTQNNPSDTKVHDHQIRTSNTGTPRTTASENNSEEPYKFFNLQFTNELCKSTMYYFKESRDPIGWIWSISTWQELSTHRDHMQWIHLTQFLRVNHWLKK